eukprot:CAMPEP_0172508038 /NCGR_PEP_ID=MMETSP1066-20121228/208721_1 /TAXON_ID=671091 /ORGANISM="Coscinodiscus wailesii, Strain CCMP2513" /LENGTH=99 /DNA_ID=CAMNT_0013285843 /DNA_START=49 /DNA_END=344 /DNA_ORIENTATION=+
MRKMLTTKPPQPLIILLLLFLIEIINPTKTTAALSQSQQPPPARLATLLQSEMTGTRQSSKPILLPCCYDGLSARLIAQAGFEATFMTGFGVSGTCVRR